MSSTAAVLSRNFFIENPLFDVSARLHRGDVLIFIFLRVIPSCQAAADNLSGHHHADVEHHKRNDLIFKDAESAGMPRGAGHGTKAVQDIVVAIDGRIVSRDLPDDAAGTFLKSATNKIVSVEQDDT